MDNSNNTTYKMRNIFETITGKYRVLKKREKKNPTDFNGNCVNNNTLFSNSDISNFLPL